MKLKTIPKSFSIFFQTGLNIFKMELKTYENDLKTNRQHVDWVLSHVHNKVTAISCCVDVNVDSCEGPQNVAQAVGMLKLRQIDQSVDVK